MSWMNNIFYVLLLTSVSGSVVFLVWRIWEKYLEQRRCIRCVFLMLVIVLFFFTVPIAYMGLMLDIYNFEQKTLQGVLFIRTPFIYNLQCYAAGVWLIGAIINLGNYTREYIKFHDIMKRNIYTKERGVREQADRIQRNLGLKRNVEIAINYGVKIPIVCGWFKKKIILPVYDYSENELEVILFHEMMHIKQHILEIKKLGIVLKLLYWFNPLMNSFLNKLDEWGETECDMRVLNTGSITFTKKQYFDVALAGLEESDIWLPRMVTQLKKERTLMKRVERMKRYKLEKGLRLAGSILACSLFLLASATSVYAMGIGTSELYEHVYEMTVVEEEIEPVLVEMIEEEYKEEATNVIIVEGIIMYSGGMSINWEVPAKTLARAENAIALEQGDKVTISVFTDPEGKSVRAGLLTPYGTKWYANGTGSVGTSFEIKTSGNYTVFVENTDSVAFLATGTVTY